jgi:zinc and cadmium transporter
MKPVWDAFFEALAGALISASATAVAALLCLPLGRQLRRGIPQWSGPLNEIGCGFAAGALLADVALHLLPSCFTEGGQELHAVSDHGHDHDHAASGGLLLGLFVFFLLEKVVQWLQLTPSQGHENHERAKRKERPPSSVASVGWLNLAADAIHNFVDGMAIGAAFLTQRRIGITTTLAVWLHEVPQEVGDFLILVQAGFSPMRALLLNFACALSAVGGAAALFGVHWIIERRRMSLAMNEAPALLSSMRRRILPFAAGGLLYLATTSLMAQMQRVPTESTVSSRKDKLHSARKQHALRTGWQILGLLGGLVSILGVEYLV